MSNLSKALSYTADPREQDFELSSTLGKIGIHYYNARNATCTGPLFKNKDKQIEHRRNFLSKQIRSAASEDIQAWKRVKTAVRRRDGLQRFLDQAEKKQNQVKDVEEWLRVFANVSTKRLVDFVETHGIPELKKLSKNWIDVFDVLCEKKIPVFRATWLLKVWNLFIEKKDKRDEKERQAPKRFNLCLFGLLNFHLGHPRPELLGRRVPFEVDENRWCRVASLLRHMFDEGLLPSSQVFEELTKMLRLVFGLIQSNQRFNERTQIMVTTEVLSYIDDALSLGFAREFHETCTAILNSSHLSLGKTLTELLTLCIKLCESVKEIYLEEPVWKDNLARLRFSKIQN